MGWTVRFSSWIKLDSNFILWICGIHPEFHLLVLECPNFHRKPLEDILVSIESIALPKGIGRSVPSHYFGSKAMLIDLGISFVIAMVLVSPWVFAYQNSEATY